MVLVISYKIKPNIFIFYKNIKMYLISKKSILFLKSDFGILYIKLPSYYFFTNNKENLISLIFLNRFFFISFLKHFFLIYNKSLIIYFIKVKIKGLGYRIRKISNDLYYFFFNYTNMFYLYIPNNILIK